MVSVAVGVSVGYCAVVVEPVVVSEAVASDDEPVFVVGVEKDVRGVVVSAVEVVVSAVASVDSVPNSVVSVDWEPEVIPDVAVVVSVVVSVEVPVGVNVVDETVGDGKLEIVVGVVAEVSSELVAGASDVVSDVSVGINVVGEADDSVEVEVVPGARDEVVVAVVAEVPGELVVGFSVVSSSSVASVVVRVVGDVVDSEEVVVAGDVGIDEVDVVGGSSVFVVVRNVVDVVSDVVSEYSDVVVALAVVVGGIDGRVDSVVAVGSVAVDVICVAAVGVSPGISHFPLNKFFSHGSTTSGTWSPISHFPPLSPQSALTSPQGSLQVKSKQVPSCPQRPVEHAGDCKE